jgi:hypothetical protein
MTPQEIAALMTEQFEANPGIQTGCNQSSAVDPGSILASSQFMRTDPQLRMDHLELGGADYKDRIEVVYMLYSSSVSIGIR